VRQHPFIGSLRSVIYPFCSFVRVAYFFNALHRGNKEVDVIFKRLVKLVKKQYIIRIIKSFISGPLPDIHIIFLLNSGMVVFHIWSGSGKYDRRCLSLRPFQQMPVDEFSSRIRIKP